MNPVTYNYQPLLAAIPPTAVLHEMTKQMWRTSAAKVTTVVFAIILIPFAGAAVVSALNGSFVMGLILLAVIAVTLLISYANTRQTLRLQRFALANNLTYLHGDPGNRQGMIFREGHSRVITGGLGVTAGEYHEIANYRYTVGSGKNSHTYTYGFVRIKLPRRLPNMVLDAKKNNLFGRISNLPEAFSGNQKLSLEGDFDKYFTLYAPKEYAQDALYVFTPDVMQAVIDEASGYDMEVIDDDLYLYSSATFKLDDPAVLDRLFRLIGKLYAEVSEQTDYYADDRVGNRAANVIAAPGQRLKAGVPWALIAFIAVVLLIQFVPNILTLWDALH